ncbi:MAG: family 10 glycosylhydrolase, partial [Prevotellaceae bacterium]|nr:family 10 glycosylhydrolase [Prevotellaceae bacterium]
QTRVRGTVISPSDLEPWDGCMSGRPGVSPGYDPLQFAIDECHRRGMQLHAWIVCIPLGENVKEGVKHMKKVHPELYVKIKTHGFMRPEREGTGDYIANICKEITSRYDIDGIHLDYIRYPEEGVLPGKADDKRANITRIVNKISTAVKTIKPWVMMSCSPIGKYNNLPRYSSHGWDAYSAVYQDAQAWLRDGLMDALFPMMYFQGDQFYPFAADWKENSTGKIIAPGLGIYFMSPKEKNWSLSVITREMHVLRQLGLGHAYFRSKFFTDDVKGIYNETANCIDNHPSLIPAMTWTNSLAPSSPKDIKITNDGATETITWSGAENNNDSPYLLYNIYASEDYPVDITDAKNLIATRLSSNTITINAQSSTLNYAVTAVDRYGNESVPYGKKEIAKVKNLKLFKVHGNWIELPQKPNTIDADYLAVKDIAGKIVTTIPWHGTKQDNTAYVGDIKDGYYQLCTLNHKGIVHRLGFFKLKRE